MFCYKNNMSYKYKQIIMLHLIHSSPSPFHTGKTLHCGPSQDPSLQLTGSCERPVGDGDINDKPTHSSSHQFFPFSHPRRPGKVDTFQYSSLIFCCKCFHRADKLPQVQNLRSQTLHLPGPPIFSSLNDSYFQT